MDVGSLDDADFVLVICTEYYRRFRRKEESGKGKGVRWEGALITQEIYDDPERGLTKYVPVVFAEAELKFRPEPIRSGLALRFNFRIQATSCCWIICTDRQASKLARLPPPNPEPRKNKRH